MFEWFKLFGMAEKLEKLEKFLPCFGTYKFIGLILITSSIGNEKVSSNEKAFYFTLFYDAISSFI
jgi:hypothetical protein